MGKQSDQKPKTLELTIRTRSESYNFNYIVAHCIHEFSRIRTQTKHKFQKGIN